jgi:hypothetical protein
MNIHIPCNACVIAGNAARGFDHEIEPFDAAQRCVRFFA